MSASEFNPNPFVLEAATVIWDVVLGKGGAHPAVKITRDFISGTESIPPSFPALAWVDVIRTLSILEEWDCLTRVKMRLADHDLGAVHFELGLSELMRGNTADAIAHFQRAVSVAAPQAFAWNSLALIHLRGGDVESARTAAEAAVAALPNDPISRRTLEAIRGGGGAEYNFARESFEGHAEIAFQAGRLLAAAPDTTKHARALFKRAMHLSNGWVAERAKAHVDKLDDHQRRRWGPPTDDGA